MTQAMKQNAQTEISSIAIDPDSQSIAVTIHIPDSGTNTQPHYWIDHMSTFRIDTQPYSHGMLLSMYGFYTEDAAWKQPQIYEGYASPDNKGNALPDVMVSANVSHMPAKHLRLLWRKQHFRSGLPPMAFIPVRKRIIVVGNIFLIL